MGMAASQARLLAITARIHDVEYQAQSIQNAKVQLSTQSDQVYNEYLEALDASTLTIKQPDGNLVTANFNTLCSKNKVDTAQGYAITDHRGRLIVEDSVYEGYKAYIDADNEKSAEAFALYMCGQDAGKTISKDSDDDDKKTFNEALNKAELQAYNELIKENPNAPIANKYENVMTVLKNIADAVGYEGTEEIDDIYDIDVLENAGTVTTEQKQQYKAAMDLFRNELYKRDGAEVYRHATTEENPDGSTSSTGETDFDPEKDFPSSDFNYYKEIYKQIEHYGDCISIKSFDGSQQGDAANNSDWLKTMLESGKFSIDSYKIDSSTGEILIDATSPSTDTYLGYTTTTTIDKSALAKAEAKYEHDLKQIDKKDQKFDLSLSKLETERTALTTEYESVKKVINDNIERTFGIFS